MRQQTGQRALTDPPRFLATTSCRGWGSRHDRDLSDDPHATGRTLSVIEEPHRTDTIRAGSCNWLGLLWERFYFAFAAVLLAVASSEASANFVCQAVGARSVSYGRAYFVADAKWQALVRCERYRGICIISYCVPAY